MAGHSYSKISLLLAALIASYLAKACYAEDQEANWSSNGTALALTDKSFDVGTGRSPLKYHPFGGLIFDFVIAPFLNAVLTIVTVGAGGFLSIGLNIVLAIIRNFGAIIWKILVLYLKAHTFGWGWDSPHHAWEPPPPPPIHYGWKRDFGGSGSLGF